MGGDGGVLPTGRKFIRGCGKSVEDKKVVPNDLLINDSVFFIGLQGIINNNYIVVYNND